MKNFQTFLLDEIEKYSKLYLENKYKNALLEDDAEIELNQLVDDTAFEIDKILYASASKIDNIIEEQNQLHFGDNDYVVGRIVNYE